MKRLFFYFSLFLLLLLVCCTVDYNMAFGIGNVADTEYPVVHLQSPANSDCVPGKFNFRGYITDDKEVEKVIIQYTDLSGDTHAQTQKTTRDFSIPFNLYTANVNSGDITFTIFAYDKAGHKSKQDISVTLDKSAPVITLFSPKDDGTGVVTEKLIGSISFNGMVNDDYQLNMSSTNNLLKIFKAEDESKPIYTRLLTETPFVLSNVMNTMDPSHDVGEYFALFSFEDVNGNIGEKRLRFTTAKGDKGTYVKVDSPSVNYVSTDSLTISGSATNSFLEIMKVQYVISTRSNENPVAGTQATELPLGQAGSFSGIISLKSIPNFEAGQYNLRVTAFATDGSSGTAVVPFEFNKDLANYEFIDSSESSVLPGRTPKVSSYINDDFYIELAASTLSLSDVDYAISQNGVTIKNWTSITSSCEPTTDARAVSYNIYHVLIDVSSLSISDGVLNIQTRARQGSAGQWRNLTRVINIDRTPPSLNISSPDVVVGINGALEIAGSSSDNMGLASVKIREDNYTDSSFKELEDLSIWHYTVAKDDIESDITIEEKYGVVQDQSRDVTFTVVATDLANNTTQKQITVNIDYNADNPVLAYLDPTADNLKFSGTLTMSATITDDDFPRKGMEAVMKIYKYVDGHNEAAYYASRTAVETKNFTIEAETGDLNLSYIIDLEQSCYEDLQKYIIVLSGSGWKNRTAIAQTRTFLVDKGVPSVVINGYNDDNKLYVTDQIAFGGYVQYRKGSSLHSENACILQYTGLDGKSSSANVALGAATEIQIGGIDYYRQAFDVKINGNGIHTGFVVGKEPVLYWGDDQWGNSSKLFTFRATSNTQLQGSKTARVYLDNHVPVINITKPSDGYLFDKQGTTSFDLEFSVNDEPAGGSSYGLNFRDNVLVQYKLNGAADWTTESNYGVGVTTALQGTFKYQISFVTIPDALNHKIRLQAKDMAGNTSTFAELTFHKSTTPPAITALSIKDAKSDALYNENITFQISAKDDHGVSDDGIKTIQLFMDGNVIDTLDLSSTYPTNYDYEKSFDTRSWTDGAHVFSASVTDRSGITVANSGTVQNIGISVDNTAPTIDTMQLLSMGLNASDEVAITNWTAYLGFRFTVSDNISLLNQVPTVKIGTTEGGDDILSDTKLLASMSSINGYQSEYTNWIDMFDVLGSNYSSTSKVYVTVNFSDAVGNTNTKTFEYSKGTLPNATFTKSEGYVYTGASSSIVVDGGYTGSVYGIWLRVGTGAWTQAVATDGSWSVSLPNSLFTQSGEYTFYLRVMSSDQTSQNIISRKYFVDIEAPTVTVDSVVPYSSTTGIVSGQKLSGKVKISGTYNDDMADKLSSVSAANLTLTIGGTTKAIPTSNITRNYNGSAWLWSYIWDTEDTSSGFLSNVVKTGVSIKVDCKDFAGNVGTVSKTGYSVVPYITSVVGATSSDKIYPVRYYKNGKWDNHSDYLKYSLATGTSVKVQGFNLKDGSSAPTVKRGSTTVNVSSSDVHSFKFATASGWQSDEIVITVGGVDSANKVYFNMWNFTLLSRSGEDYDTLYAKNYDMTLLSSSTTVGGKSTNPVFVTFARNTKLSPDYTARDYSAYSFYEGSTSKAYEYGTKSGLDIVDPVFYAAMARKSDTEFYSIYTYDEWGVDATRLGTITKTGGFDSSWAIKGPINRADCVKKTRLVYNGNKNLYIGCYDDESRSNTPSPKVYFGTVTPTNNINLQEVDSCSGYFDVCYATNNNYPVMVYGKNGSLYSAYVNSSSNSTLSGKTQVVSDGDKYCKIVSSTAATTVHLVYQDANNNVAYRRISSSSYGTASTKVAIECADTEINGVKEGVTGFNANIDIAKNSAKTKGSVTYAANSPHISYINNSVLNTTSALRYARCKSSTSTTATDWEYMVVPSTVSVNDGPTYVKTDTSNNPVILYTGNDRLYIARLAD